MTASDLGLFKLSKLSSGDVLNMGLFVLYLRLHDSMDITTKPGYLAFGASSDLGHLGHHASGAGSDPGLALIPGWL